MAQERIPQNSDRKQALEFYSNALKEAGLSSVVALPSGEVVASPNPAQVGQRIRLKRHPPPTQEKPIQISAEHRNRWQLSRVIFTACFPSLIHCSALPRLL